MGYYNRALRGNRHVAGWYNGLTARSQAEIDAEAAAAEALKQVARDADTLAREVDEHHFATNLKRYRAAQVARASAEAKATPAPAPLAPITVDVVPDPAKVAAAVERLRAPRTRSPGGISGDFSGRIRL